MRYSLSWPPNNSSDIINTMKNKAYILVHREPYEGDTIYGVYSTEKKARKAQKARKAKESRK
ncbi:MAG: hypothetical protein EBU03_00735, partial [Methylophilaceae bacterium]|nr:hypothetical protein [Methylophilaceae bacterium]